MNSLKMCDLVSHDRPGHDQVPHPRAHLASWAQFAPGISESVGRKKGNSGTGKGNRYLARVLGEATVGSGKKKAIVVPRRWASRR